MKAIGQGTETGGGWEQEPPIGKKNANFPLALNDWFWFCGLVGLGWVGFGFLRKTSKLLDQDTPQDALKLCRLGTGF